MYSNHCKGQSNLLRLILLAIMIPLVLAVVVVAYPYIEPSFRASWFVVFVIFLMFFSGFAIWKSVKS